jgi:pimeloyl-ACP methyl ester carboxylesterase
MNTNAQPEYIHTRMGKIAVYKTENRNEATPLILLHGVYFDHHLWDRIIDSIHDRTVITVDMPLHGKSKAITNADWSLNDCADMLLEILDSLQIPKVIAVGHSWGSMTILRAASKQPEKFESVLLCNMPFLAATKKQKLTFGIQHSMLIFRNFYTKQAAKALFGESSLKVNPKLIDELKRTMDLLTNKQIKQTDRAVIANAEDISELIKILKVKALALKGEEDYVPAPPDMESIIVKGGHISPLEATEEVLKQLKRLGVY